MCRHWIKSTPIDSRFWRRSERFETMTKFDLIYCFFVFQSCVPRSSQRLFPCSFLFFSNEIDSYSIKIALRV
jgi:hypothetical protein